ncbi:putative Lipoprotein [Bacillus subtilis]|uniref:hypothetical protein n=1 Tax=Bacillus subtilis TaxID=1423 RepID=UPI001377430A|nr:hypothetical protein [Bacillus subtilis]KAF1340210.1 putative Lipoprotein [Bacillus subtilis]
MKKSLWFAIIVGCLVFVMAACGKDTESSTQATKKEETPADTSSSDTSEKDSSSSTEKKTLSKAGDSLKDPNVGTITADSVKDNSDKSLEIGDLKITFKDAKVLTATNLTDGFKVTLNDAFGEDMNEFTYAQISYDIENVGSDEIKKWNGFETAVDSEGQQVDLSFNDTLGAPNPSATEIMSGAKVGDNMVLVPVLKGESNVRIKAADVLKDSSAKDFLVRGKDIKIDLY